MSRGIALPALKNLCAFIGAIALFSYFYNWGLDQRHWHITVGSAGVCFLLWFGFCVIEMLGGVRRVAAKVASGLSRKTHRKGAGPQSGPELDVPVAPAVLEGIPQDAPEQLDDALQGVSRLETGAAELAPVAEPALPANAPVEHSEVEPEVATPNPLPWLKPRRSKAATAGKEPA